MGLMTARRSGVAVDVAEVLDGQPAAEVLTALEVVASALLDALAPGDKGIRLLRQLGMAAATWSLAGGGSR